MLVIIYRKLKSFKGNYLLCYWEALLKTICEYKIVEKAKMLSGNLVEKEILNVYQVFWCFFTVFFLQNVCLIIKKELTLTSKPDQFNLFLTYMPKIIAIRKGKLLLQSCIFWCLYKSLSFHRTRHTPKPKQTQKHKE
jgi:hypothetical protein